MAEAVSKKDAELAEMKAQMNGAFQRRNQLQQELEDLNSKVKKISDQEQEFENMKQKIEQNKKTIDKLTDEKLNCETANKQLVLENIRLKEKQQEMNGNST